MRRLCVYILDHPIRKLRTKEVASLKVLWRNKFGAEATREANEEIDGSIYLIHEGLYFF